MALALLVQGTMFGRFELFGLRPDLALLCLLVIVQDTGGAKAILYGFLIGFAQDVYSPELLGYNAVAMSVTAYFIDVTKERFTVENYSVSFIVTISACILHDLLYLVFYTSFEVPVFISLFIKESLPGAVYTSAIAVVVIRVREWLRAGGFFGVLQELCRTER